MYLREQSRDMAVGIKVSGDVTEFSRWTSRKLGEAIH